MRMTLQVKTTNRALWRVDDAYSLGGRRFSDPILFQDPVEERDSKGLMNFQEISSFGLVSDEKWKVFYPPSEEQNFLGKTHWAWKSFVVIHSLKRTAPNAVEGKRVRTEVDNDWGHSFMLCLPRSTTAHMSYPARVAYCSLSRIAYIDFLRSMNAIWAYRWRMRFPIHHWLEQRVGRL